MKETRILMGMPITIEIADISVSEDIFNEIFSYFKYVDEKFSTYKDTSEIMGINRGEIKTDDYSDDMKTVLALSEKTKRETNGYFNIARDGKYDPSGLVKGWSIYNASRILKDRGFDNFFIDAGGDVQVSGKNAKSEVWKVGIRNPFNTAQIVKVVCLKNEGVATSGTYIRGEHIYNPKENNKPAKEIVSLTVIGPNVYEADRFVTAAFAMGMEGIDFIENLNGFEGYLIDKKGFAIMTSGFEKYIKINA